MFCCRCAAFGQVSETSSDETHIRRYTVHICNALFHCILTHMQCEAKHVMLFSIVPMPTSFIKPSSAVGYLFTSIESIVVTF